MVLSLDGIPFFFRFSFTCVCHTDYGSDEPRTPGSSWKFCGRCMTEGVWDEVVECDNVFCVV